MKRLLPQLMLGSVLLFLGGCSSKPCDVSSDCGSAEACVAARCSALSCGDVWYAVDPSTGVCTPLSGCADHAVVGAWKPCDDPCAGLGENACKQAPFCQATYTGSATSVTPVPAGGISSPPSEAIQFRSCRAVAVAVDPCSKLDAQACTADSRCEQQAIGVGCDCASDAPCNCPSVPAGPTCALKSCGELASADACNARPDCSTTPEVEPAATPGSGTTGSGTTGSATTSPQSAPFQGCFPVGGCGFGADETTCLKQHACAPVYDGSGKFGSCIPQDFSIHCASASDCADGQRCNSAGICVVAGCAGDNEAECNADLHCEPVYSLNCSPYANGGGGGGFCGPDGVGGGGGGPLPLEAPAPGTCSCEPTFSNCQPNSGVVDVEKSVLVRDPAILDDPYWALPHVLALVSGSDANAVADGLLGQLGTAQTVSGQTAAARPGAAAFIATLPRTTGGVIDASQIGLVPTSLSNRLDLADASSCGEARVTYALGLGATDRRHRMTLIVELRQPLDGAGCRTVAKTWLGLSQLSGAALQSALQSIYAPLLTPANLKQVRTNEFLVGPQDQTQPPAAWELREFHLGTDARLHQSLLPLQVDPATVQSSADFLSWVQANASGLQHGTVSFPAQYQVPTGNEDGSVVSLSDPSIADLVNRSTCAGCHTTATNSAFAHVAERFGGTGRAEISQFLAGELGKRANHLGLVASGAASAPLDVRPLH